MRKLCLLSFVISQIVFLAFLLLLFLSLIPFTEGSTLCGWYSPTITAVPSTEKSAAPVYSVYSVHAEYRGIFFADGVFAIGYMVEDYSLGTRPWTPSPGFRLLGNRAYLPLNPPPPAPWNVFGIDIGPVLYGNPVPPDSWRSNRIRFNAGLVLAIEAATLAIALALLKKSRKPPAPASLP